MSRYVNELFRLYPITPTPRPGTRQTDLHDFIFHHPLGGFCVDFFCSAWFPSVYPEITCGLSVFFLGFEKPAEFSLADVLQSSDRFCTLTEPQLPRTPLSPKTPPYLLCIRLLGRRW